MTLALECRPADAVTLY